MIFICSFVVFTAQLCAGYSEHFTINPFYWKESVGEYAPISAFFTEIFASIENDILKIFFDVQLNENFCCFNENNIAREMRGKLVMISKC